MLDTLSSSFGKELHMVDILSSSSFGKELHMVDILTSSLFGKVPYTNFPSQARH